MSSVEVVRENILKFLSTNGEKATGEIARGVGKPTHIAKYHLTRLLIDGLVERRFATPKVIMWKITDKGRDALKQH